MITLIPNLSILGCEVNQELSNFYWVDPYFLLVVPIYLGESCNFQEKFSGVDIRVTVKGGGHVAQVYAIRQAISKALIAFYQKCKL